jgi:hypothetical protein
MGCGALGPGLKAVHLRTSLDLGIREDIQRAADQLWAEEGKESDNDAEDVGKVCMSKK